MVGAHRVVGIVSHEYHEGLPSFDENAIWQDGCRECEARGDVPFVVQLAYLDDSTFRRAWMRARAWNEAHTVVPTVAESGLLRNLYAVAARLERIERIEAGYGLAAS